MRKKPVDVESAYRDWFRRMMDLVREGLGKQVYVDRENKVRVPSSDGERMDELSSLDMVTPYSIGGKRVIANVRMDCAKLCRELPKLCLGGNANQAEVDACFARCCRASLLCDWKAVGEGDRMKHRYGRTVEYADAMIAVVRYAGAYCAACFVSQEDWEKA